MTHTPSVLLLVCSDMMWISRCLATAQALGLKLISVRDADRLLAAAAEHRPSVVIFDLESADPATIIPEYKETGCPLPRWVAFGPHVARERLQAAAQAGCDPVLPRSRMAEEMAERFQEWTSGAPASESAE